MPSREQCRDGETLLLSDDGHSTQANPAVDGKPRIVPGASTLVRVAIYFANFGFSKAAAYLAPLVLAAFLDGPSYGIIEYAWSWSVLVATLLTLGIPAAIPQLSLLRRPVPVSDIMMLCVAGPGAVLTTAAFAAMATSHSPVRAIVLSACVFALAQVTLSSYSRTFSHRNLALWFEGLSTYGMAVVALCLALVGLNGLLPLGILSSIVAAIVVIVALTLFARLRHADFVVRLRGAVRLGLPLLAFMLSSIWAAVSGRVYIGAFLPIDELSVYSVDFRIASALLIVHSIVATGLFARLYNMPSRLYDRYLSLYLAAIALLAIAIIASFPLLLGHFQFRSLGTNNIPAAITLFPIVMLQVYAWGAWASLEMRLARTRRSAPAARKTIALMVAVAALLVGLGMLGLLSLRICAILVALQMLGGVAIELWTLWRRGAKMPRTTAAISFGVVLICVCGWAMAELR
jgi:O-antigen/teichoic acid export membrane protein